MKSQGIKPIIISISAICLFSSSANADISSEQDKKMISAVANAIEKSMKKRNKPKITNVEEYLQSLKAEEVRTILGKPQKKIIIKIGDTTAENRNAYRIIKVRVGDTLSKISKRAYGSKSQYLRIYRANKNILKNPNSVTVGMSIRIPPLIR